MTVSCDPQLLTQEPGSTVKHLNFPVPLCIPPGSYNLTYYELYRLNSQEFFSITPIPVTINNPGMSTNVYSSCPGSTPMLPMPQASNPSPVQAWLQSGYPSSTMGASSSTRTSQSIASRTTSAKFVTVTQTQTLPPTTVFYTITFTVSAAGQAITTVVSTVQTVENAQPTLVPVNGATSRPPFGRVGVGGIEAPIKALTWLMGWMTLYVIIR